MTVNELRKKYLEFFKKRGHVVIPSARLVPENDPTTLFTSSGMQPLVPYLLGQLHPEGVRLANSQLSFRAQDIEEVGDNRHTTFFEMLGNWSLGDYFKKEQLPWLYEFLTKELNLPKEKLWVTCFVGDDALGLPKDTESYEIWKSLGVLEEHIRFYDSKKNWWSRSGTPEKMPAGEPGGPDSEVFFEFTSVEHNTKFGETCHPNCDCGRFMEIGNSVFMEYIKTANGFEKLPKQNVDFGGGLERLAAASLDSPDVFMIDVFAEARTLLEEMTGMSYRVNPEVTRSFRIILDHTRAALFILSSGVHPSNTEQGYVLRRLLRRAILMLNRLKKNESLSPLIKSLITAYKDQYPELDQKRDEIETQIDTEERKFILTIGRGMHELEKLHNGKTITTQDIFILFTTHGFPVELIQEVAEEKGISIDFEELKKMMKAHQDLSRAGAAQKFTGGLADHQEQTIRYHTAHHLLLATLRKVLGPDVHQRGSNITSERLRIDFSYGQKMTKEQLAEVERIVNEKITEELPVVRTEMKKEEAEKLGAEHEFGVKYPDMVSVYSVGSIENAFSLEFCGGPHVSNTRELGTGGKQFKIQKEEAVAAGIRRIKAVLQ